MNNREATTGRCNADANKWIKRGFSLLGGALLALSAQSVWAQAPAPEWECTRGSLPPSDNRSNPPNLTVKGHCTALRGQTYYYGNINIVDGGALGFIDVTPTAEQTHLWASSIIIENGGSMYARGTYNTEGY